MEADHCYRRKSGFFHPFILLFRDLANLELIARQAGLFAGIGQYAG
jgi:hypothetical protein